MSSQTDPDDDPRGCTRTIDCGRCNVPFKADGILEAGMHGITGETPDDSDSFKPHSPYCAACEELGCAPTECPSCGHYLRGTEGSPAGYFASPYYTCSANEEDCYTVVTIRTYGFGLACKRIVRERPHPATPSGVGLNIMTMELILRAAREWGVIQ